MNLENRLSTKYLNCQSPPLKEYIFTEANHEMKDKIYILNNPDKRQGNDISSIFNIKLECKICSKTYI